MEILRKPQVYVHIAEKEEIYMAQFDLRLSIMNVQRIEEMGELRWAGKLRKHEKRFRRRDGTCVNWPHCSLGYFHNYLPVPDPKRYILLLDVSFIK